MLREFSALRFLCAAITAGRLTVETTSPLGVWCCGVGVLGMLGPWLVAWMWVIDSWGGWVLEVGVFNDGKRS
jgi:hypothetical protein